MAILYIIGNGFDRHHGLDTSYTSFARFLRDRYPDLYNRVRQYIHLPELEDPYEDETEEERRLRWQHQDQWNRFEAALSDFDFEEVLDDAEIELPDYSSDSFRDRDYHAFTFEMERIVKPLTSGLRQAFIEFISGVQFEEGPGDQALSLNTDSVVLNFNYTGTIERYYHFRSEQILYLHGRVGRDQDIVLGHGVSPDSFEPQSPQMPEGLSDAEREQWQDNQSDGFDWAFEAGKSELMNYYYKSYKPTQRIIEENLLFFEGLANITEVVVIGHSLAEVDQPYLLRVKELVGPSIPWKITYHGNEDFQAKVAHLRNMGFAEGQAELVPTDFLLAQQNR
jgi:hypothetical protein